MSDVDQAIQLVRGGTLTLGQLLSLHHDGQLRPLPGQGVRVVILGSVPGYCDEPATFHPELAAELVRRGAASYVS